jgi:hypothetical protein
MRSIDIAELIKYFGHSTDSPEFIEVLKKQNIELKFNKRELLNDGSAFIENGNDGFNLGLSGRQDYISDYKKNPTDFGKFIFRGIDIILASNNDGEYQGKIGFNMDGIKDKKSLIAKHGKPFFELLEDDGRAYDQRWRINESVVMSVSYSDDDTISLIQFGIPFADFYK